MATHAGPGLKLRIVTKGLVRCSPVLVPADPKSMEHASDDFISLQQTRIRKTFRCPQCKQLFGSLRTLVLHIRAKCPPYRYCKHCGEVFTSRSLLYRHVIQEHHDIVVENNQARFTRPYIAKPSGKVMVLLKHDGSIVGRNCVDRASISPQKVPLNPVVIQKECTQKVQRSSITGRSLFEELEKIKKTGPSIMAMTRRMEVETEAAFDGVAAIGEGLVQPSPKDSGVDVSSPSRRDYVMQTEDVLQGSCVRPDKVMPNCAVVAMDSGNSGCDSSAEEGGSSPMSRIKCTGITNLSSSTPAKEAQSITPMKCTFSPSHVVSLPSSQISPLNGCLSLNINQNETATHDHIQLSDSDNQLPAVKTVDKVQDGMLFSDSTIHDSSTTLTALNVSPKHSVASGDTKPITLKKISTRCSSSTLSEDVPSDLEDKMLCVDLVQEAGNNCVGFEDPSLKLGCLVGKNSVDSKSVNHSPFSPFRPVKKASQTCNVEKMGNQTTNVSGKTFFDEFAKFVQKRNASTPVSDQEDCSYLECSVKKPCPDTSLPLPQMIPKKIKVSQGRKISNNTIHKMHFKTISNSDDLCNFTDESDCDDPSFHLETKPIKKNDNGSSELYNLRPNRKVDVKVLQRYDDSFESVSPLLCVGAECQPEPPSEPVFIAQCVSKHHVSSQDKVMCLRQKIVNFIRIVFPDLTWAPVLGHGANVEVLMDQVTLACGGSVPGEKCHPRLQVLPTKPAEQKDVAVMLCRSPRACIKHLRRRVCKFLEHILPNLQLTSEFDRSGPLVDELLQATILANSPP